MKRFFILGTDTDCGKTYVTCQLLDYFKNLNKKISAIKPVASGCIEQDGQLVSEDVVHLAQHNGVALDDISFKRFQPPISPHLAAEAAKDVLLVETINDFCNSVSADLDYLLIEGAGGLMVPLNRHETWVDFLALSQIPVILVVGMRLGCLNHALLTAFALKAHRIPCVGWVANCIDKDMLALSQNIATLNDKMDFPLLVTLDFDGCFEGASLMERLS